MADPKLSKTVVEEVASTVKQECEVLSRDKFSQFVADSPDKLKQWSFQSQYQELKTRCPAFFSVMESASGTKCCNPGLLTAASVLLNCRNVRVNGNAKMVSLILKKGAAKKSVFSRLNKMHLCTSYPTALELHYRLGEGFDRPVQEWKNNLQPDKEKTAQHGVKDILPKHLLQKQEGFQPVLGYTSKDTSIGY